MIQIPETFKKRRFLGSLHRFVHIINRYSLTKKRIFRNLIDFSKFAEDLGFRITISITALTLKRHHDAPSILNPEIVDVAIHGLKHIEYTRLSFEETLEHLKVAQAIFKDNGLDPMGFRAPYLKINESVLRAIGEVGLKIRFFLSMPDGELKKFQMEKM